MDQENNSIMLYEICRLCLEDRGYCDIFEKDYLSQDINRCIGVKILLTDNLPQRICENCLDIVNKATELSKKAKKSEFHLKSLFGNEKEEIKETTDKTAETVISAHFYDSETQDSKNPVIEKFISVRTDLYESSVSEDSILNIGVKQARSPQKTTNKKRLDTEDEKTEYKCSILLTDNLPQRICENCLDIVNKATELSKKAKKSEFHLKSLFGNEKEEIKETTDKTAETVISAHFYDSETQDSKNPVIEKFISVRTDLYESSVSEDSILNIGVKQARSPQKTTNKKRLDTEDEKTEYKCSICSKTFDIWKKLIVHSRFHNKRFECPISMCGKRFCSKGDVEKHIRIHTGEKPYKCDLCDKSFAQRGTLKAHKETIHSVGCGVILWAEKPNFATQPSVEQKQTSYS